VSELKIDRSFVTDIDSKLGSLQLVKTMIEMGHGMGLLVTAEGIETAAERDTLARLGCDVMQGYLAAALCLVQTFRLGWMGRRLARCSLVVCTVGGLRK
jgi:EAL domain-containing protein (putative c-di-GMP-specific phosphodiesterase class I)